MACIIVIAGAGVSGLTTALLLSRDKTNKVTVVAKHMPGDKDVEYASPWAGANYMPMATDENSRWERRTWPELHWLAENVPEAGLHFQKVHICRRDKDMSALRERSMDSMFSDTPWFKDVVPDYRELRPYELIPGHDGGCEFTSVCINTAIYLPWLVSQCLRNGVVFKRHILEHISEAKALSHTGRPASVVVNATALGSLKLRGVEDKSMMPASGQTVLVRNSCHPMLASSGTDDGDVEWLYMMERAAGGGTIIGGTYDLGNWQTEPDPVVAQRIMQRAVEARPEIADGKGVQGLDVVSHNVGLRPYRTGGVRVEADALEDGTRAVHNYGHGGFGYQASYGCAERVVELVNEIRKSIGEQQA